VKNKAPYKHEQSRSVRLFCNMWLCPSDYICARFTERRDPRLEYGNYDPRLEYGNYNPQMDGKCESFIPVDNYKEIIDKKFKLMGDNEINNI